MSQLQAYVENPIPGYTLLPPPPITVSDHEEFKVEGILDHKIHKYNKSTKRFFLVKWKGYPDHDAIWEKEEVLKQNANETLQDYLADLPEEKQ